MVRTSFKGIRKGQRFIVIANNGGHNYPLDKVLLFSKNGTNTPSMENIMIDSRSHNHIRIDEIKVLEETVEEMKAEIARIKNSNAEAVKELESRIQLCEELGMDVYDEDFVKVYRALQVLNSDSSILEKTQLIVNLLKE